MLTFRRREECVAEWASRSGRVGLVPFFRCFAPVFSFAWENQIVCLRNFCFLLEKKMGFWCAGKWPERLLNVKIAGSRESPSARIPHFSASCISISAVFGKNRDAKKSGKSVILSLFVPGRCLFVFPPAGGRALCLGRVRLWPRRVAGGGNPFLLRPSRGACPPLNKKAARKKILENFPFSY